MHYRKAKVTLRLYIRAQQVMSSILSTYLLLLVITTSVRLEYHQVRTITMTFSTPMIPCGMVMVAVQLAHAAHSTIHHGFVNNYLSQVMLTWKLDCAQQMKQIMKILR
jgi:hypothetical protein